MRSHGLPSPATTSVQWATTPRPTSGTSMGRGLRTTSRHCWNTRQTTRFRTWRGQCFRKNGWEYVSKNSCKFSAFDHKWHVMRLIHSPSLIKTGFSPLDLVSVCMGVHFIAQHAVLRTRSHPHFVLDVNQFFQIGSKTGIIFLVKLYLHSREP